ncbi:MAG: PilW family protein [bacterium]
MPLNKKQNSGLTTVELMVALVVTLIVSFILFNFFIAQNKHYISADKTTVMQQRMRDALLTMVKDTRMAGYDPSGAANAGFIQHSTNIRSLNFTMDENGNGDCLDAGEDILYSLAGTNLMRNGRTIAENVEDLEFNYVLDDDTSTTAPTDMERIRLVQITLLARIKSADDGYINTLTYTPASGATWGPFNDNFKRQLLRTTIRCRNMGLL